MMDGKTATAVLLAINVLRRRRRDGEMELYSEELGFYSRSLDVSAFMLDSMAKLETTPVLF